MISKMCDTTTKETKSGCSAWCGLKVAEVPRFNGVEMELTTMRLSSEEIGKIKGEVDPKNLQCVMETSRAVFGDTQYTDRGTT